MNEDELQTNPQGIANHPHHDTMRVELSESLKASEARFRNIIEKNVDGILVIDWEGTLQFVNPAAEVMLCRPVGELVGSPFGIPIVPGETTELDLPCQGGRTQVVEMRTVETEWEGCPAFLASLRDITERKRAEEMVRRAEERFRQISEAISDFTYSLRVEADGQLTLEWLTVAFFRLTGYSAADVQAMGWTQLIHPEDHALARLHVGRLLAGESDTCELRVISAIGEIRWLRNGARPIRDPLENRIHRIYGAGQDITERRRLEAELHRRVDELAELGRRKDEFLAMMAHELRNPLAPIRNAVTVLRDAGDSAIQNHMREIIGHQVTHLARLLDDLLDVTRITRGKIRLRPESTDLATIIEHAVEPLRGLFAEGRVGLAVVNKAGSVPLMADPTRIQQVLSNLLNNSLKYTDPGGFVRVELLRDGSDAVIRVLDTGIGIAPEMLPRIFDPFAQADASLDRPRGGLGIGLTLARTLVKMHGGTLEASSPGLGFGSEFTLCLPVSQPMQPLIEGMRTDDLNQVRQVATDYRTRILVVDDNVDAANSLAVLLRLWGHDTFVVHDGAEAIAAARTARPSVVLLDIGLPKLDGYQVARALRAELGLVDSRIIAMTGYGQAEDRRRTREAGFDLHLVKPVDLEQLEAILAEPFSAQHS